MLSQEVFDQLGPLFARRGWVFFAPWRRGQGLSADAGPYIEDQIKAAWKKDGVNAAATTMVRLLQTEHLNDQLAGLAWLQKQNFVAKSEIAVMGNSFGRNRDGAGSGKGALLCRGGRLRRRRELGSRTSVAVSDDQGRQQLEGAQSSFSRPRMIMTSGRAACSLTQCARAARWLK